MLINLCNLFLYLVKNPLNMLSMDELNKAKSIKSITVLYN
jgi:hypothetical protein